MSYRALARSAPLVFFPLGLLARLPYAITSLGTLLLLQHATGSHAFTGLAAGAQSMAIAVAGLAAGWLATRVGTRRLGMVLTILNALSTAGLVVASLTGSRPAMLGGAVLVGLTQPHVGLFVRVHWSRTLGRGTPALRTAFAYESAVDELSFVAGPAVIGLFAILRPGDGPLLGMALLLLAASLPFAARYTQDTAPRRATGRVPWRDMAPVVASMVVLGAIFGAIQTATAAHAPDTAGFLYACLAVGSAVSGFAYAWLPETFRLDTRYVVFSGILVLGMTVLALSPLPLVGILVAGCAIAPYMITLYALTDRLAPPDRLPVAMAALGAGGPVGTAIGQVLAGTLVSLAWWVPVGFACVGLLVRTGVPAPRPVCPRDRAA
jgi:hypothetical protein